MKIFTTLIIIASLIETIDASPPVQYTPSHESAIDAAQVDVIDQFNLGLMYHDGQGVEQSYETAAYWFQQAAERGYAKAQYNLGHMYHRGNGVGQNYQTAAYWYTQAAEQGDANAQCNLGHMYHRGNGVGQNYQTAAYWYTQAAEQGDANAQYNLGHMYHRGNGVGQNYQTAAYWYTQAAEQGDANAQGMLGLMYDDGLGVEQNYETAVAWFQQAAEQGDALAQFNLGLMYYFGHGLEQSDEKSGYWFQQAAKQGDMSAQNKLGIMYETGRYGLLDDGLPNLERAAFYLNAANRSENTDLYEFYQDAIQKQQEVVERTQETVVYGDTRYALNPLFFTIKSIKIQDLKEKHPGIFAQVKDLFIKLCEHVPSDDPKKSNQVNFLKSLELFKDRNEKVLSVSQKAFFTYLAHLNTIDENDQIDNFNSYLHMLRDVCNTGKESGMVNYVNNFVDEDIKNLINNLQGAPTPDLSADEQKITDYIRSRTQYYIETDLSSVELHRHFGCDNAQEDSDLVHNIAYLRRVLSGHLTLEDPQTIERFPHVVFNNLRNMNKQELVDKLYSYYNPSFFVKHFHNELDNVLLNDQSATLGNALSKPDFVAYIAPGYSKDIAEIEEDVYSFKEPVIASSLAKVGLLLSLEEQE